MSSGAERAPIEEQLRLAQAQVRQLTREVERLQLIANEKSGLLDAVLSQSPYGIIVSDPQGKLILQNEASQRIWAGSADTESVRDWGQYRAFHPDGRPYAAEDWAMARSLSEQVVNPPEETRFLRFDDTEGVLLGGSAPIFGADGKLSGAVSVFADITHLKKTEEALRASEVQYATTLQSIGDAVIATDAGSRITFMNAVAEALTGWPRSEAVGREITEVFRILSEATRRPADSPVERALREGAIGGLASHTLLVRRDGAELSIDDSAAPVRTPDGKLLGVVLVFRDVTEKRRDEQRRALLADATRELAASLDYERTLSTITRWAVPKVADWAAVDLVDGSGAVRRLSVAHVDPQKVAFLDELERRYPSDPNAAQGVPNVIRTGKPELVPVIPDAILAASARDPEHLRLIRELGLHSYIVVPLSVRGMILGAITFVAAESKVSYSQADLAFAEELARAAAISIDNARLFRDQKRLADERARLYEEARKAVQSRDEFLAVVSHDLRNPLSTIVTGAALLEKLQPSDDQAKRALKVGESIRRASKRMESLIRDLLDVASIDAGRLAVSPRSHPVTSLLGEVFEAQEQLLRHKQIGLTVERPSGIGEVFCDRDRVLQVFSNLVGNSLKFTPPGGSITISATPRDREVEFAVLDSGPGIAAEFLPRIFERYWKGQGASASAGVGLGLAIAKGIVDAHGGRIGVDTTVPAGARVWFTLPISERPAEERG